MHYALQYLCIKDARRFYFLSVMISGWAPGVARSSFQRILSLTRVLGL